MATRELTVQEKLGLVIYRWFKDFRSRHDALLETHQLAGLRASHSAITVFLAERPHRLSELAALNGMRPQSVLKLVNELEKLGYVERVPDPSDTRAKLIQFTSAGSDLLQVSSEASATIYALYKPAFEAQGGDIDEMLSTLEAVLSSDAIANPTAPALK